MRKMVLLITLYKVYVNKQGRKGFNANDGVEKNSLGSKYSLGIHSITTSGKAKFGIFYCRKTTVQEKAKPTNVL